MGINDSYWMRQAYQQALLAQQEGEVPVGALLVNEQQQLIAISRNAVQRSHDPTEHAEIRVLRQAAAVVQNHRLLGCTLYVTLEPCAMCAGALVHARVKRVVFAARDFKAGAAGSVFYLFQGYAFIHKFQIDEGIMEVSCSLLLSNFFKSCRE